MISRLKPNKEIKLLLITARRRSKVTDIVIPGYVRVNVRGIGEIGYIKSLRMRLQERGI